MNFGGDTHKSSFVLAAVDALGSEIAWKEFDNHRAGCLEALRWIRSFEGTRLIGIEGTGMYGALLARVLMEAGEQVREVPTLLVRGERKKTPSKGKSDRVDAFAVAKVVAKEEGLTEPKSSPVCEELKLLVDERASLVQTKTQLINQLHADLVMLRPGYERQIPRLTRKIHFSQVRKMLRGERSIRGLLVRERLSEIDRILARVSRLEALIKEKVIESGTTLHHQRGIGFVLAGMILGEVGHASRIPTEGAFAMLSGTAPIEASSGKVKHHRLNRRGNRRLNYAIHSIALVRSRSDAATRAFMLKKRAEGKSYRDAMRCLKRHISNSIYRQLRRDEVSQMGL